MTARQESLKALRVIPGVGPSIARDLYELGIRRPSDLRRRNPEALYRAHCTQRGRAVDRCLLYVFRCAVYFASTPTPEPELLKWWNWKENSTSRRQSNQ